MIVATAGHVNHGKTLLVKALTGVDLDRLPEEKKRGMTIDLGFAYLPVGPAEPIGFVDVPGHARFVRNMLCGVSSIDYVLFIVAADDGPMPQTDEHLAILDLLVVRSGAVVLTKIDRVPPERLAEVQEEIQILLAGTTLEGSPVFLVSAVTGEGVEPLKQHLTNMARNQQGRPYCGNFRLAIDRSFNLPGAGLIVTGTVVSGSIAMDSRVHILKAGISARVRTIHAQNIPVESCRAGQRCALNLTGPGVRQDSIQRGDWAVTGNVPDPVEKLEARLRILPSELRPFTDWTPVHVHLGAAEVTGRVAVLEASSVAPGASALIQLALDRPLGAVWGDRFIIRDQTARRSLGGGQVINVFSGRGRRTHKQHSEQLMLMEEADPKEALGSLLNHSPNGFNLSEFAANRNLTDKEAGDLFSTKAIKSVATSRGLVGFSTTRWHELKEIVRETLVAWHRRNAGTAGPDEEGLLLDSGARLPRVANLAITAELMREGVIIKRPSGLWLAAQLPKLSLADKALWSKVSPLLDRSPMRPPTVHDIATALQNDPKKMEEFLVRASHLALLVRVSENRFFKPDALRRLGDIAEEVAANCKAGTVTVCAFRDRTKIGRVVAVEVLDYFDRIEFTRRVDDTHQFLRLAAEVFGTA